MAQRVLVCPKCSANIEVPDNYFRAGIQCGNCGAVVDRRTGALPGMPAQPAAAQPQQYSPQPVQPQQYTPPRPQAPRVAQPQQSSPPPLRMQREAPVQYPQGGGHYANHSPAPQQSPFPYPAQYAPPQYSPGYAYPPAQRKNPTLKIVLIVLGAVFGLGMIAGVIAVVGGGGGVAGENVNSWSLYESRQGRYSLRMPVAPKEQSRPMPTGAGPSTLYAADATYKRRNFGAAYFDIPVGPDDYSTFDYVEGARATAQEGRGTIVHQGPHMVSGQMGYVVKIQQRNSKFFTKIYLLHHGNRVYLVLVEAYTSAEETVVDAFLNSFLITK